MSAEDDSVLAVVARLVSVLDDSGETYAFGGAIALAAWSGDDERSAKWDELTAAASVG